MFECGPFLNDVVFEELKFAALGEYSRLLIEGSVLEVKDQIAGYAISAWKLCPVAHRDGSAFLGPQN